MNDQFSRSIFCDFSGDDALLAYPAPTGILQQSYIDSQPLYLLGITLSSTLYFASQSVNGVWVILGHQEKFLFLGGTTKLLAAHTVIARSGGGDAVFSRTTWATFPKLYVSSGTPISIYANGLVAAVVSRACAQCALHFSKA